MADDQRGVRPPRLGGVELLQPRLGLLQRGARLLTDPQPLHEVEDAGVGARVLRELVPVADELAVLQRRADGPPGPGAGTSGHPPLVQWPHPPLHSGPTRHLYSGGPNSLSAQKKSVPHFSSDKDVLFPLRLQPDAQEARSPSDLHAMSCLRLAVRLDDQENLSRSDRSAV